MRNEEREQEARKRAEQRAEVEAIGTADLLKAAQEQERRISGIEGSSE